MDPAPERVVADLEGGTHLGARRRPAFTSQAPPDDVVVVPERGDHPQTETSTPVGPPSAVSWLSTGSEDLERSRSRRPGVLLRSRWRATAQRIVADCGWEANGRFTRSRRELSVKGRQRASVRRISSPDTTEWVTAMRHRRHNTLVGKVPSVLSVSLAVIALTGCVGSSRSQPTTTTLGAGFERVAGTF